VVYLAHRAIQSGGSPPHSKTQTDDERCMSAIPRLRESAAIIRRF
jgi:hypothetical protein